MNSVIYNNCKIKDAYRISIGNHSCIENYCIRDKRGGRTIGNAVNFSTGVWVWTSQLRVKDPDVAFESAEVLLEDYVRVSYCSVIFSGVRINKDVVVTTGGLSRRAWSPI
jgi:acetyltransferase-like isoleucine patch superfamily enzyme